MTESDQKSTGSVVGDHTMQVGLAFVVLKLIPYKDGHVIDWSWWWVLSPYWGAVVFGFTLVGLTKFVEGVAKRRKQRQALENVTSGPWKYRP